MSASNIYPFCAYHGTTSHSANIIFTTRRFVLGVSRNDHWLGQGAYFYREDYEQAAEWARIKIANTPALAGESPSVIEVILEAPGFNFLNLDTRNGLFRLLGFLRQLEREGIVIAGGGASAGSLLFVVFIARRNLDDTADIQGCKCA
jgi:hypothetical protein